MSVFHRVVLCRHRWRPFVACFLALCFGGAAHAQSLLELYRAADTSDPAVAAARAQHRASLERETQARAGFGPTANFTVNNSHSEYGEPTSLFAPEARHFNTRQATLQINMPLYKPGLVPQLRQAEAQSEQARLQRDQASVESMQRFVEAAFEMLKARDALQYLRVEQTSTAAQLKQAQRSFTVGTVAVTDVRDAQAKADVVAAQVSAAEFDLSLRHQVFMDLVGRETPALLARGLVTDALPPLDAQSLTQWVTQAHDGSPSLRQAQWALEAARQETRKSEMAHAPTLDASFSFFKTSETGSVTSTQLRQASQKQVGVTLTIPLFASGATQSRVLESMALQDKALADLENARRMLALNVRQSFSATLSAVSQARGLTTAVKSQEVALRASQRGYEVGMKVNSEVLAAQSKLFEAQRDLSKARYDAWLAYMKLKGAAGQIAEADLSQLDALLVPLDKPLALNEATLHPTPLPALLLRGADMPPEQPAEDPTWP